MIQTDIDLSTIEHLDFEPCCQAKDWLVFPTTTKGCDVSAVALVHSKCFRCGDEKKKLMCESHLLRDIKASRYNGNYHVGPCGDAGGRSFYISHVSIK